MTELVDLDTVKSLLRIDHTGDDAVLEDLIIPSASAMVLNYLKVPHDFYEDTAGEVVPDEVKHATAALVGILLNGKDPNIWDRGYLPATVTAILYPLRDPAVA